MKIYIYYDEDDHPVDEAPTVSPAAGCKGLRKGSKRYSVEEVDDDGV